MQVHLSLSGEAGQPDPKKRDSDPLAHLRERFARGISPSKPDPRAAISNCFAALAELDANGEGAGERDEILHSLALFSGVAATATPGEGDRRRPLARHKFAEFEARLARHGLRPAYPRQLFEEVTTNLFDPDEFAAVRQEIMVLRQVVKTLQSLVGARL